MDTLVEVIKLSRKETVSIENTYGKVRITRPSPWITVEVVDGETGKLITQYDAVTKASLRVWENWNMSKDGEMLKQVYFEDWIGYKQRCRYIHQMVKVSHITKTEITSRVEVREDGSQTESPDHIRYTVDDGI